MDEKEENTGGEEFEYPFKNGDDEEAIGSLDEKGEEYPHDLSPERGIGERRVQTWPGYDPFMELHQMDEYSSEDQSQGMSASNWAVPWSDLMMTMFILFAVMLSYVLSERDLKEAFNKQGGVEEKTHPEETASGPVFGGSLSAEQLFEMSRQTVKEANLEDVDVVMDADRSVRVSVRGPLLFDLGSAELRDETKAFLGKMSLVLAKTNNEVHVVGHTDNFPIHSEMFPTNWELSSVRAARVARYLIEKGNLNPERFTITGHSMFRPSAPNTTPENKQSNRRVEIIITKDIYKGISGG